MFQAVVIFFNNNNFYISGNIFGAFLKSFGLKVSGRGSLLGALRTRIQFFFECTRDIPMLGGLDFRGPWHITGQSKFYRGGYTLNPKP